MIARVLRCMVVVLVPLSSIDLWLSASLQVDLNLGVILDYDFNKLMVKGFLILWGSPPQFFLQKIIEIP